MMVARGSLRLVAAFGRCLTAPQIALLTSERERAQRLDLYRFQLEEIDTEAFSDRYGKLAVEVAKPAVAAAG